MAKSIIYSKPSKAIFVLLTLACLVTTFYAGTKIEKDTETNTISQRSGPWFLTLMGGVFLSFALLIASTAVVWEVKSLM